MKSLIQFIKLGSALLLILGLGISGLQAQETILATGGNTLGSGGSVSYSIGQITYTTNTGANGSVAQGVQQPYEISIVSGLETVKNTNIKCTVYPNPTTNHLILEVERKSIRSMLYQLHNLEGKLLLSKKLTENKNTIIMENLTPAIYFLKVYRNNEEIRTFKIIKR